MTAIGEEVPKQSQQGTLREKSEKMDFSPLADKIEVANARQLGSM